MRKALLLVAAVAGLMTWAGCAMGVEPTADKKAPDPRLAQLVSIECKDVRVHTVVSRLWTMTGVEMGVGTDVNDWRSRDVPIAVRVKGVSLGRLLYAIADATHLHLARFQKGDDKPYYRMYRTTKQQGVKCRSTKLSNCPIGVKRWTLGQFLPVCRFTNPI